MLIAASTPKIGRCLLILGLHEENITRLRDDQPIYKSLDEVPGLDGWDVTILGPEDMARFIAAADPPPSTDPEGESG